MQFEFATATEIVFGRGRLSELGKRSAALGQRVLVVRGSRAERISQALELLREAGLELTELAVTGEPTTQLVEAGVAIAREHRADLVIGIGGGSVLDSAKAVAALSANGGDPLDYLEVVGRGRALTRPSLPCVAVPTTSGTGSEVTKNSVLQAEAPRVKVSLRSLHMLPRLALIDPELTVSVPPDVTAATGLDALTQVIEPFVSNARGPLTDALCVEGIRRAARSLLAAYRDGTNLEAREDLSVTSLFGGLALANAKLGAVHGFAGPLGGAYAAPHGALCARLLPEVTEVNLRAVRAQQLTELIERYRLIATLLTGDAGAAPEDGVLWLRELVHELKIPGLGQYGVALAQIPSLVQRAQQASSMKGNPVSLSADVLSAILERSL